MDDEKQGMKVSINANGCKTEFSQEFKDCEKEKNNMHTSEISNIKPESGGISCNSESKVIKVSFKVIALPVLIFSVVVGIISAIIAKGALNLTSSEPMTTCVLIIIISVIFVVSTLISLVVTTKTIIPFSKMEFLRTLIESNKIDRELIKKYCDTLAEL